MVHDAEKLGFFLSVNGAQRKHNDGKGTWCSIVSELWRWQMAAIRPSHGAVRIDRITTHHIHIVRLPGTRGFG